MSIADELDLNPGEIEDLRTAALLHDAGVSRTHTHKSLLQLDWKGAGEHCREGADLLRIFPYFDRSAEIVLHHHTKWEKLKDLQLDSRTALMANILFLADRIDALLDWKTELILNRKKIEEQIEALSGSFFKPEIVDIFLNKSVIEVFWLSLYSRHLPGALAKYQPEAGRHLDLAELETIASIFATIVDNKSPFTIGHSEGVARLCHFFAASMGLPETTVKKLRIAGLFHDLGKLAVPDEILEKPSFLTTEEFQIIKRHPYETYYILSHIPALEDIRDWASFHHEKPDGSGYPFHITRDSFTLENTIVQLSDIIQALIQDRPHRPALGKHQIMDILEHLSTHQLVFSQLMQVIRSEYDMIAEIAAGKEPANCVNM